MSRVQEDDSLEYAVATLSPANRDLITGVAHVGEGTTDAEDLAFVYELLNVLIVRFENLRVEWPLVAARKALLRAGALENIVSWDDVGGQSVEHVGDFPIMDLEEEARLRKDLQKRNIELATQTLRANALDGALVELRKEHDYELLGLRQQIADLRAEAAQASLIGAA